MNCKDQVWKKVLVKDKRACRCCERSTILDESATWCLSKRKVAKLKN